MGPLLILVATGAFTALSYLAWLSKLGLMSGLPAMALLAIAAVAFFIGRKNLSASARKRVDLVAKVGFTIVGCLALLRHPIDTDVVTSAGGPTVLEYSYSGEPAPLQLSVKDAAGTSVFETTTTPTSGHNELTVELEAGTYTLVFGDYDGEGQVVPADQAAPTMRLPIYSAIESYIGKVDRNTFILFAFVAMGIKFVGVLSSAFAWHLLLVGQGIRFPFWQKIVTAFLIGRFIGTFLPSTIGLDGYTLYEAGKYSGKWPRAITAKGLEKFIGVTGLFLGMVVTLPFGYSVIESVMADLGKPDAAPLMAGGIVAVAGGVSAVVVSGLVYPGLLKWGLNLFGRFTPGAIRGKINQFVDAVGAYQGKTALLLLALANKFVTHFTTAVVYFFTALAIGVVGAEFWPVVFGSTIQILATLLSPTIAGEGAREAFQALLLKDQLGGVAPAVLSGALGFIAAEAATLWGGAFLWTRKPGWRPKYTLVDGEQVDYAWIDDSEDTGFDADKIAQARADHADD